MIVHGDCRVCGVRESLDEPVTDESAYEPLCLSCWHWWQTSTLSVTIAATMTRVLMEGLFGEDQAYT